MEKVVDSKLTSKRTSSPEKRDTSDSGSKERLLQQLRQALKSQGNFPAHARAVTELRELATSPKTKANQIAEIILREPPLATRLLHIVNSSFYRRAKPIMTISQAVIQIGMEPLVEVFSGMALLKNLAAEDRDSAFIDALKKTICTSLLTSSLLPVFNPVEDKKNELGYLIGMFSELGILALAHYFPRIYETSIKRAVLRGQRIETSLRTLTGLDTNGLALEVIKSLDLPPLYKSVINACSSTTPDAELEEQGEAVIRLANSIKFAQAISCAVVIEGTPEALKRTIEEAKLNGVDSPKINRVLGALPQQFDTYCQALEIDVPALPSFLNEYSGGLTNYQINKNNSESTDRLNAFLDEIRSQVTAKESSATLITTVMETLAWGLKFDRVLLLLKNRDTGQLIGRTILGQTNLNPKGISRPSDVGADRFAPDAKALREDRPIFQGDPILPNGWPIVALPVGLGENAIGVIYADRLCFDSDDSELSDHEKGAISLMTELMDKSLSTK